MNYNQQTGFPSSLETKKIHFLDRQIIKLCSEKSAIQTSELGSGTCSAISVSKYRPRASHELDAEQSQGLFWRVLCVRGQNALYFMWGSYLCWRESSTNCSWFHLQTVWVLTRKAFCSLGSAGSRVLFSELRWSISSAEVWGIGSVDQDLFGFPTKEWICVVFWLFRVSKS